MNSEGIFAVSQSDHFTTFALITPEAYVSVQFRNEAVTHDKEKKAWGLRSHSSPTHRSNRPPAEQEMFNPRQPVFSAEILNYLRPVSGLEALPRQSESKKVGFV